MSKIVLSILFLLITLFAFPQRVGLVLSGGGAKGIAHIGLIKVLEDHNIPIDYITGTSIGAIIGGLYAAGYSPEEMLELFNSDDFKLWSTGKIDKEDLYYFKQKDELPNWMKVDVTKKADKIKVIFPINLIPEQQMDFAFLQLMARTTAACDGDFDSLMVPFRCISTDIYHGKAVIHKSGDVGEAIRASMTFPLVFKPIEMNGMFLFDGGMVNNFPTDVMTNDFAPDIIIGHKVSNLGDMPDKDDFVKQIEAMVTQITDYEIPDSAGILLESKLDDVGLLDFPKANYTYSRGIETALQEIDSIEKIVTRRVPLAEVQAKRDEFKKRQPSLIFNNVQVEGIENDRQRKYIIQSIKSREKVIDMSELKESYFRLISDEHIKSIQPKAYFNKRTGLFDLSLKVEPRKPFDADFGGHLSTRANTFGYIGLNYKTFNQFSFNFSGNVFFGKFYNSLMAGARVDAPTLTPFFVSASFTLNSWDYLSTSTDLIFNDIKSSYVIQNENNFRFEAGYPYAKKGLIDFGLSFSTSTDKYYQTLVFNQGDELDLTTFDNFSTYIRIDKKSFDYRQFPVEGGRKMFIIRYVDGTELFDPGTTAPIAKKFEQKHSYIQLLGVYDQYFKLNKYWSLGAFFEGSFNNKKFFSNYTSSVITAPAFNPTPNSKSLFIQNFRANQYLAVGGKVIYKINDDLHLRTEAYGFAPVQRLEAGENYIARYNEKIFSRVYLMGMGALVYQTPVGPVSVEMNYYDKPGDKWFFSVNFGYMLFNKRGF